MANVQGVLDKMSICIIVPTHNESNTIQDLIMKIKERKYDVVVIDDGSTDNTAEEAKKSGAHIIRHGYNKGKGMSLREGFDYALKNNYDVVITMDGDGQHDPENLKNFIDKMATSKADIIIGNRMDKPKTMPLARFITNKFMSYIISKICRQHIPDSQCGYRLIKTNVLKSIELLTTNFEIESEVLIAASRNNFRIESVPIKTIYRDERSKISPVIDTVRFINFISRQLWSQKS